MLARYMKNAWQTGTSWSQLCNMHVVCFVSCLRWIDQQQEDLKSNAWITCGSIVEIQPGPSSYTFHGVRFRSSVDAPEGPPGRPHVLASSLQCPNPPSSQRSLGLPRGRGRRTAGTIRSSPPSCPPAEAHHPPLQLLSVVQVQKGCLGGNSGWSVSSSAPPAPCSAGRWWIRQRTLRTNELYSLNQTKISDSFEC